MIVPVNDEPGLSPRTIAALMNSRIMDQIFRCINGSVAVSAYELEALPLPPHQELMRIEDMIQSGATNEHIENEIERFYATSPAYPASKRSTTACRSSIRREFRTGTIASGRYRPERSLS
jgi:hypothetical protein